MQQCVSQRCPRLQPGCWHLMQSESRTLVKLGPALNAALNMTTRAGSRLSKPGAWQQGNSRQTQRITFFLDSNTLLEGYVAFPVSLKCHCTLEHNTLTTEPCVFGRGSYGRSCGILGEIKSWCTQTLYPDITGKQVCQAFPYGVADIPGPIFTEHLKLKA